MTTIPLSQILGGGNAASGFLGGTPVGGMVYLPEDTPVVATSNNMTFLRSGSVTDRASAPGLANTPFDLPNMTTFRNFNIATGLTNLQGVSRFLTEGWRTPDGAALIPVGPLFNTSTDISSPGIPLTYTFRYLDASGVITPSTTVNFLLPSTILTDAATATVRCRVSRIFYSGTRFFAILYVNDANNPGNGQGAYIIYEFTVSGGTSTQRYYSGWRTGTNWTHPGFFVPAISGSRIMLFQWWNQGLQSIFIWESSNGGTSWSERTSLTNQLGFSSLNWVVGTPTQFVIGYGSSVAVSTTGAANSFTQTVASTTWASGLAHWVGGNNIVVTPTSGQATTLGRSTDNGTTFNTITVPTYTCGSGVSYDPLRSRMYIGSFLMSSDSFATGQVGPLTINSSGAVVTNLNADLSLYRVGAYLVGGPGEMRDTPNGAIGIERPATLGSLVNYLRIA